MHPLLSSSASLLLSIEGISVLKKKHYKLLHAGCINDIKDNNVGYKYASVCVCRQVILPEVISSIQSDPASEA